VRALLQLASSRRTAYSAALGAWCDDKGREVVGSRLIHLLHRALGSLGLAGLHRVLGFSVLAQLHALGSAYSAQMAAENLAQLHRLSAQLGPPATLPEKLPKLLAAGGAGLEKRLWPELLDALTRCGSAQLLRRHLAHRLGQAARLDGALLASMLRVGNKALLVDVSAQLLSTARPAASGAPAPPPSADVGAPPPSAAQEAATAAVAGSLSPCLDAAGLGAAHLQVFLTSEALPLLPLVLTIFTVAHAPRLAWKEGLATLSGSLSGSAADALDGAPLAAGIATLLRQFHREHTLRYLALLDQYVRAQLHAAFSQAPRPLDNPPEVATMLLLLESFCDYAEVAAAELPSYLRTVMPSHRVR